MKSTELSIALHNIRSTFEQQAETITRLQINIASQLIGNIVHVEKNHKVFPVKIVDVDISYTGSIRLLCSAKSVRSKEYDLVPVWYNEDKFCNLEEVIDLSNEVS